MSARTTSGSRAPARTADGARRAARWWTAAAAVGVIGGFAHYLLVPRALPAGTPPGVRDAARVSAEIDLACWVVLGVLWLVFVGPLRAGRGWAKAAMIATTGLAAILDLMNLVGSWATFSTAVVQLALLATALLALSRLGRPAR
jgi:hypothetical protein